MKKDIKANRRLVEELFETTTAVDSSGKTLPLDDALEQFIQMILAQAKAGGKLMLIGNGASASISSHIATDFWRNVGVRAIAFNDAPTLTCISNDFGYVHVFEKPIEMFADENDMLIAISSSGRSENIVRGVKAAQAKGIKVATLSGFNKDNPLSKLGHINFHVPSHSYGHVEVVHHFICHSLIDVILKNKLGLIERKLPSE